LVKLRLFAFAVVRQFMNLTVAAYIFPTLISQVAKGAKPQARNLFVEGIEFTQGWDMRYFLTKKVDISFKRTLNWNQSAKKMGNSGVGDFNAIEPMTNRLK
jgi:hypothetical protein